MSGKKRGTAQDSSMIFSSCHKKHERNIHKINAEMLTIENQNSKVIHKRGKKHISIYVKCIYS